MLESAARRASAVLAASHTLLFARPLGRVRSLRISISDVSSSNLGWSPGRRRHATVSKQVLRCGVCVGRTLRLPLRRPLEHDLQMASDFRHEVMVVAVLVHEVGEPNQRLAQAGDRQLRVATMDVTVCKRPPVCAGRSGRKGEKHFEHTGTSQWSRGTPAFVGGGCLRSVSA